MRRPIDVLHSIKPQISSIVEKHESHVIFKRLSESLAALEDDILSGEQGPGFLDDLSTMLIDYISFFCQRYGVEDSYRFFNSRDFWGIHTPAHFENTKKALVIPYYELRSSTSNIILKRRGGMPVRPVFDLIGYMLNEQKKRNG